MRLFRYVEEAEWDDIVEFGCLRAGPNSCGPGKWLARTKLAAWAWGSELDDGFPGRVVTVEVDEGIIQESYSRDGLDGIGDAVYVVGLADVQVTGVEERT